MKINIFGVGRSGTKAVQVYLTYLLARHTGDPVHVNYEPYFWQSRNGPISYEGLIYHYRDPLFALSPEVFSESHRAYLTSLSRHQSVVTKFIRGNGRIAAIDRLTAPDHTIVIVRDLYSVLESLLDLDWNLYSEFSPFFGMSYRSVFPGICAQLETLDVANELRPLSQSGSRIAKNALYWYVMNRAALNVAPRENLYFLDYAHLQELENLASRRLGLPGQGISPENKMFRGTHIHDSRLFRDQRRPTHRIKRAVNRQAYYLSALYGMDFVPFRVPIGGAVTLSGKPPKTAELVERSDRCRIERNGLLDFLDQDIRDRLASRPHLY